MAAVGAAAKAGRLGRLLRPGGWGCVIHNWQIQYSLGLGGLTSRAVSASFTHLVHPILSILPTIRAQFIDKGMAEVVGGEMAPVAKNASDGYSLLPDDAIIHIAHYCLPSDVHNLCLTCKRFYQKMITQKQHAVQSSRDGSREVTGEDEKFGASIDHGLSPNENQHRASLFAQKLVYDALLRSLNASVRGNRFNALSDDNGDFVASFTRLSRSLPKNAVLLSGSIMVQTILGQIWENSDIDIYCTHNAAPAVRAWLFTQAGLVLTNVSPGRYNDMGVEFGHVEQYTHETVFGLRGKTVTAYPSPCKIKGITMTTESHVPIRHSGVEIPYHNIDLVVMARGFETSDAINNFDIKICQCTFDGVEFVINNPIESFKGRTEMTELPSNAKLKSYMKHFVSSEAEMERHIVNGYNDYMGHEILFDEENLRFDAVFFGIIAECTSISSQIYPPPTSNVIELVKERGLFSPELDFAMCDDIIPCIVRRLRTLFIRSVMKEVGVNNRNSTSGWLEDVLTAHNNYMRKLDRLAKYERRGVSIDAFIDPGLLSCPGFRYLEGAYF
jgi:hypothetical protein